MGKTCDSLHLDPRTEKALEKLSIKQGGNKILIVGAQFGLLYRGYAVRQTRLDFSYNEFGAHSVGALSMCITHPERFVSSSYLHCDLPGDKLSRECKSLSSIIGMDGDQMAYTAGEIYRAQSNLGSVTFFCPH